MAERKLRVLMLSWEYPPHTVGGLGKHVLDLLPALDRHNVEVHLLTPRWMGGSTFEVLQNSDAESSVYRVPPPEVHAADFFTSAWRTNLTIEQCGRELIDRIGRVDLIHAHDWLVAFAGVALKHAYKIPLVSTIHATESGRNRGNLYGDLQRAIHNVEWELGYESWRVITTSAYMRGEVQSTFNLPADKIDIIPNGVDPGDFLTVKDEDLTGFRNQFALPDEHIVYSIGRLVPEKGIQVLVDAAPFVLSERPDTKFVVAGTGGFGQELQQRAIDRGVADRFYFAGFVTDDDRNRLYKVADVAVFPSLYEPFGIVALEAMAARTPVVASSVGGFAEVITNHETGLLTYPDNPSSLAWAIVHTLNRPDWAQQRVDNAYRMVREQFNWDAIARQTIDVYRRVAAERAVTVW